MNSVIIAAAALLLWLIHTWMLTISSSSSSTSQHTPNLDSSFLHRDEAISQAQSSSSSFTLCKEQSDGFFTDISNENWKLAQTYHAKLFPNYYNKLEEFSSGITDRGNIQRLRNSNKWYGQNFQVEFICPLARRLPSDSMMDGPKWVSAYVVLKMCISQTKLSHSWRWYDLGMQSASHCKAKRLSNLQCGE